MWVRSFSTRLTSATFAEDKCSFFLFSVKMLKYCNNPNPNTNFQSRSDKLEWYIVERYMVFYKSGPIKERTQTNADMGKGRHVVIHDDNEMGHRPILAIRTWPCINILIFTHNLGSWLIAVMARNCRNAKVAKVM